MPLTQGINEIRLLQFAIWVVSFGLLGTLF
jgi:hypothetical protein